MMPVMAINYVEEDDEADSIIEVITERHILITWNSDSW